MFDKARSYDAAVASDFHPGVDQQTPCVVLADRYLNRFHTSSGGRAAVTTRGEPSTATAAKYSVSWRSLTRCGKCGFPLGVSRPKFLADAVDPETHTGHVVADLCCEFIGSMESSLGADVFVQNHLNDAPVKVPVVVQKVGFQQSCSSAVVGRAPTHRDSGSVGFIIPSLTKADGACPDAVPDFPVRHGDVGGGITELSAPGVSMANHPFKADPTGSLSVRLCSTDTGGCVGLGRGIHWLTR